MKDYSYKVNVWDILNQSSTKDTVRFEKKFSTLFPQLVDPWISCDITIQWMDRSSLLVYINNAQATTWYICDKCATDFIGVLALEPKELKCFFDWWTHEQDEEIIYIQPKEKQIDFEQYLVESFFLQESVVHVCSTCEKTNNNENDENNQDITQKITF